jgi:hypothetical protein
MAKSWNATSVKLGTYGPFFLPLSLRLSIREVRTHFHCIGISGSGKSRFLAGLYLGLLRAGLSATLVDPHGDLARLVLAHLVADGFFVRPGAREKLLYLDLPAAERAGRYLPFNVLRQPSPPHSIAANVIEAMHRAWPALAGGQAPMFDVLVQSGVKVLISNDLPLPALFRFLLERDFRDELLAHEPDDDVVGVFRGWYDRLPEREQLDQSGSALRRVGLLIFDPVLKYSLAQRATLLNFREIVDTNQSLIVNLALHNTEARRLLGCLLTVGAEQGALSRAELPPGSRFNSHHLIVDEFSQFAAQSEEAFSRMLSQTRKHGLFLVAAHQTWSQASERLRGALQNVGVEVTFKLGREDAVRSAPMLGRVDPLSVKHEVADGAAVDRTHPVFFSLAEQWEAQVQAIQDLKPRQALVRRPNGQVAAIQSMNVPDPRVNPDLLAEVEEYYLRACFRSQEEVAADIRAYRPTRRDSRAGSKPATGPDYTRFIREQEAEHK